MAVVTTFGLVAASSGFANPEATIVSNDVVESTVSIAEEVSVDGLVDEITATTIIDAAEATSSDGTNYKITIENVSSDQPLAPGAYVIHDDTVSLNFDGQLSPASFEPLSEIGSNDDFVAFVEGLESVKQVIRIDAPVMPGESTYFEVTVPHGYLLSGLQMPVGTNDGLALIDSVVLDGTDKMEYAANYDNGTEDNSPLGSGFEGGQPDPARGAENIDNGVATDPQENFRAHPELTADVLKAHIDAYPDMDTDMKDDQVEQPHMDDDGMVMSATDYTVTINNVSSDQPLAPGIYVIHNASASLNFEGQLSPAAFESLAEIGSPAAAAELVMGLPGVMEVIVMDAPVLPGESTSFDISVPDGYLLSGLQMPVGTNDGLVLIDAVELNGTAVTVDARNYDNGTEDNSPLGSGFEGGQPDPARGAENIDNGVATDPQENFRAHPELTETVLRAEVTPHASSDLACNFVAFDQNNMSYAIVDGQTVPVFTNVGLHVDGDDAVDYTWYVDYDGDDIEVVEQREVVGSEWSYTVWRAGQFDYSATVADANGNTSECSITVHAADVVATEN